MKTFQFQTEGVGAWRSQVHGKYASTAYLDAKAKREQTEANAAARRTAK